MANNELLEIQVIFCIHAQLPQPMDNIIYDLYIDRFIEKK